MILQAEVEGTLDVARAISEYGILIVIAAAMIICMFLLFKHFLGMFQDMFEKVSSNQASYETPMEQVRVLQSVTFDLAKYIFLEHLERIYRENHLDDKESVKEKIKDAALMIYNDRKSKFDNFKYHGYSLSYFCDEKWVDKMLNIGMKYIYIKKDEFDPEQTFSAIDIAYNQIKIEFYNNVISKS